MIKQRAGSAFFVGAGVLGLALWALSSPKPSAEVRADRPQAPATSSESAALARLERRVQELEAAARAAPSPAAAPEATAPLAKPAPAPQPSIAEQEDAIQADYDRRIDGQPDDAAWAKSVRDTVSGALSDPMLEGSQLAYVECSTEACRVGFEHGRTEAREALPTALMAAFGRGHDLWGRDALGAGRAHTTVYVTRKEVELREASDEASPLMRAMAR